MNNAKTGITADQANAIIANKSSIATNTAAIGAKISITDVVDDLTTGGSTVPLSAEQGKILKGLIESYLASITNAVSKTGDQTIAGAKTFSETIVGNINGNATTVTNGVYTTSSVTALTDVTSVGSGAIITAAERTKLTDIKASTGLEMITEGSSTGYRLVGRKPMFYKNIGTEAVDLSSSGVPEGGASGSYSFAAGLNTKAGAWGATAMGEMTEASGMYSLAMISGSIASGVHSVAIGDGVRATTYGSTVFGSYNVLSTLGSADIAVGTDPLFELGNGTSHTNRSNALTILKNGTITAPDFTDALITAAGDQALITKKYADANYGGATPKTYTVNTFYAELGGYVIEVNSTGTHGLVVAMQDQGASNWYEANDLLSDAAKHDVNGKEFKDWRIPTKRELNLLKVIYNDGVNGARLNLSVYWSSTESDNDKAWRQNLFFGTQDRFSKSDILYVRAVRAF